MQTIASRAALKFVGPSTLEGLTGNPVYSDLYESGKQMAHINLAKWADITVLCPATANTINKLSQGMGDDLLSSLFLAHDFKKPYFLAPAMNTAMYRHPATQESLEKLSSWGVKVLSTGEGRLACGDVGEGKLLEPELIAEWIESACGSKASTLKPGLKFLITSGGTEEPIDGVRSISNFSSGRTGAEFANYLDLEGHDVTLLRAERAQQPQRELKQLIFKSFHDLDHQLKDQLSGRSFDCVLHLAAVSDYSVDHLVINGEKIKPGPATKFDSDQDITLSLARNYKIVDRIREYSLNPQIRLVAFKLTKNASEAERETAVINLLKHSLADWVVHNDLTEVDPDNGKHQASIYKSNRLLKRVATQVELIEALEEEVLASLEKVVS